MIKLLQPAYKIHRRVTQSQVIISSLDITVSFFILVNIGREEDFFAT